MNATASFLTSIETLLNDDDQLSAAEDTTFPAQIVRRPATAHTRAHRDEVAESYRALDAVAVGGGLFWILECRMAPQNTAAATTALGD
jgi:hypothetical protein